MALYIPAAQRRRKVVVTAVVAAVAGMVLGIGLGRVTAPKAADQAAAAKEHAKRATGQLEAFPLHYEETRSGKGDRPGFDASLAAGVARADDELVVAFADAPWIDDASRAALRARVAAVKQAADREVPPAQFETAVRDAVSGIGAAFGLSTPS